jgi:type IV secretory pathway component VirB8
MGEDEYMTSSRQMNQVRSRFNARLIGEVLAGLAVVVMVVTVAAAGVIAVLWG